VCLYQSKIQHSPSCQFESMEKRLEHEWKTLSVADRQLCYEEEYIDKDRYNQAMAAYQASKTTRHASPVFLLPPPPASAFALFCCTRRAALAKAKPNSTNADLLCVLYRVWLSLPKRTRSWYEKLRSMQVELHEEAMRQCALHGLSDYVKSLKQSLLSSNNPDPKTCFLALKSPPGKPAAAFDIFCSTRGVGMKNKFPEANHLEIVKTLSHEWQALPKPARDWYMRMQLMQTALYDEAMCQLTKKPGTSGVSTSDVQRHTVDMDASDDDEIADAAPDPQPAEETLAASSSPLQQARAVSLDGSSSSPPKVVYLRDASVDTESIDHAARRALACETPQSLLSLPLLNESLSPGSHMGMQDDDDDDDHWHHQTDFPTPLQQPLQSVPNHQVTSPQRNSNLQNTDQATQASSPSSQQQCLGQQMPDQSSQGAFSTYNQQPPIQQTHQSLPGLQGQQSLSLPSSQQHCLVQQIANQTSQGAFSTYHQQPQRLQTHHSIPDSQSQQSLNLPAADQANRDSFSASVKQLQQLLPSILEQVKSPRQNSVPQCADQANQADLLACVKELQQLVPAILDQAKFSQQRDVVQQDANGANLLASVKQLQQSLPSILQQLTLLQRERGVQGGEGSNQVFGRQQLHKPIPIIPDPMTFFHRNVGVQETQTQAASSASVQHQLSAPNIPNQMAVPQRNLGSQDGGRANPVAFSASLQRHQQPYPNVPHQTDAPQRKSGVQHGTQVAFSNNIHQNQQHQQFASNMSHQMTVSRRSVGGQHAAQVAFSNDSHQHQQFAPIMLQQTPAPHPDLSVQHATQAAFPSSNQSQVPTPQQNLGMQGAGQATQAAFSASVDQQRHQQTGHSISGQMRSPQQAVGLHQTGYSSTIQQSQPSFSGILDQATLIQQRTQGLQVADRANQHTYTTQQPKQSLPTLQAQSLGQQVSDWVNQPGFSQPQQSSPVLPTPDLNSLSNHAGAVDESRYSLPAIPDNSGLRNSSGLEASSNHGYRSDQVQQKPKQVPPPASVPPSSLREMFLNHLITLETGGKTSAPSKPSQESLSKELMKASEDTYVSVLSTKKLLELKDSDILDDLLPRPLPSRRLLRPLPCRRSSMERMVQSIVPETQAANSQDIIDLT